MRSQICSEMYHHTKKVDVEEERLKYHSEVTFAQDHMAAEPDLDYRQDEVAPNTEHVDVVDRQQYNKNIRQTEHQEGYDIGQDLGLNHSRHILKILHLQTCI